MCIPSSLQASFWEAATAFALSATGDCQGLGVEKTEGVAAVTSKVWITGLGSEFAKALASEFLVSFAHRVVCGLLAP